MNKYKLISFSLFGGILSGLAWTDWCPGLILLISFVPFFYIGNYLYENRDRYTTGAYFIYLLPGFTVFCILTLGWIRAISLSAAICIILIAAILMAFTMLLGHMVRIRTGSLQGFVSGIALWLTLEYLSLRINVISPWVMLGNGLAKDIPFIQWYEITGAGGGTLWILLSNLCLTRLVTRCKWNRTNIFPDLSVWAAVVIVPAAISFIRYCTIEPSSENMNEAVIVQPDFDPYTEKFSIPFKIQLEKSLKMAESEMSESTDWVVAPETLIDDPVNEDLVGENKYVARVRDFLLSHPDAAFVAGMVSYSHDVPELDAEPGDSYYNSAFKIDTGPVIEIYHKSRLVPGFEFIPAGRMLQKLSKILPVIGFKNRDYGTQPARTCFLSADKSLKIAPVICYESVYGEFVTEYIKEGAAAIFIITNDGWWKNTKGYKQHLSYASLRAIETRRPVVRSANTGISCFMDIRGKIIQKADWWTPAVLKGNFYPETRITSYVKYGDLLLRAGCFISLLTLFVVFIIQPLGKRLK